MSFKLGHIAMHCLKKKLKSEMTPGAPLATLGKWPAHWTVQISPYEDLCWTDWSRQKRVEVLRTPSWLRPQAERCAQVEPSPLSSHEPHFFCGRAPKFLGQQAPPSALFFQGCFRCAQLPPQPEEFAQHWEECGCPVLCRDKTQGLL